MPANKSFTRQIALATLLLAFAMPVGAQGDYMRSGFTLSLREDLIDVSMPEGTNLNPTRTHISHIFGTELSVGFREVLNSQWSVGLSVGLMLHDYAWTNEFADQPVTTSTDESGSTYTDYSTFDGQTTLNLPLTIDVKFRLSEWADQQMWDIIPMLSTRIGYVVGLTSIYGERYRKHTWPDHPEWGVTAGREEVTEYIAFNKQGVLFAMGIGFSYKHLDFELEYAIQPSNNVMKKIQLDQLETEAEPQVTDYGAGPYAFAAGDGFTLRLTYNF